MKFDAMYFERTLNLKIFDGIFQIFRKTHRSTQILFPITFCVHEASVEKKSWGYRETELANIDGNPQNNSGLSGKKKKNLCQQTFYSPLP